LQAERAGDFAKAIAILAATPVERVTPRQGVPRDSLPAVETCQQRGYGPGTLLASESWQRPRRIVEVQSKYVVLVTAGKSGKDRVRSLPKDAFVVEKP